MPYGPQTISTSTVFPTRVSADGCPRYKVGGITIDLTTVPAASGTDTILPDQSVIKAGAQFLRYGQVMTRMDTAEVQTITFTGGPTAGSAILTLPAGTDPAQQPAQSTNAIAFNATAATVQGELNALTRIGPGGASVARTGTGTAGDPYIYTATFSRYVGNPPQLTATNTFTGGTTPTVTLATTTGGQASAGKWGPYDPGATDGRATIEQGAIVILDSTILIQPAGATFPGANDIRGEAIEGGTVWFDRIMHSGALAHTAALGPTLAELLAAMPGLYRAGN